MEGKTIKRLTKLKRILVAAEKFEKTTKERPACIIVSFETFSEISTSLTNINVDNNYMTGVYNGLRIKADKFCPASSIITVSKPESEDTSKLPFIKYSNQLKRR